MAVKVEESKISFSYLRNFNKAMGILHLVQGSLILILGLLLYSINLYTPAIAGSSRDVANSVPIPKASIGAFFSRSSLIIYSFKSELATINTFSHPFSSNIFLIFIECSTRSPESILTALILFLNFVILTAKNMILTDNAYRVVHVWF